MSAIGCRVCSLAEFNPPPTLTFQGASLFGGTPSIMEQTFQCQGAVTTYTCEQEPTGIVINEENYSIVHDNSVLPSIAKAFDNVVLQLNNVTGSAGTDQSGWTNSCVAGYNIPQTSTAPLYVNQFGPQGVIEFAVPIPPIGDTSLRPTEYCEGLCCGFDCGFVQAIDGYARSNLGGALNACTISVHATPCQNTWALSIAGSLRIYQRIRFINNNNVNNTCDPEGDYYLYRVRDILVGFNGSATVHDLSNINVLAALRNIDVVILPSADIHWTTAGPCGTQVKGISTYCFTLPSGIVVCQTTSAEPTAEYTYDQQYAKISGGVINVSF